MKGMGIYEYARATGHSVKHIYELIRLGKLPAKKTKRKWIITAAPKEKANTP